MMDVCKKTPDKMKELDQQFYWNTKTKKRLFVDSTARAYRITINIIEL